MVHPLHHQHLQLCFSKSAKTSLNLDSSHFKIAVTPFLPVSVKKVLLKGLENIPYITISERMCIGFQGSIQLLSLSISYVVLPNRNGIEYGKSSMPKSGDAVCLLSRQFVLNYKTLSLTEAPPLCIMTILIILFVHLLVLYISSKFEHVHK